MPVFTWVNPVIIRARFWLYWAITIPLTITVLAIWVSYLLWVAAVRRQENKKIREENILSHAEKDDSDDNLQRSVHPLARLWKTWRALFA